MAIYRLFFIALFAASLTLGCGSAPPKNDKMPDGERELMRDKGDEDPLQEPDMPMREMSSADQSAGWGR